MAKLDDTPRLIFLYSLTCMGQLFYAAALICSVSKARYAICFHCYRLIQRHVIEERHLALLFTQLSSLCNCHSLSHLSFSQISSEDAPLGSHLEDY